MREHFVPFSVKEEAKLVFNLSARQCLWFMAGFFVALIFIGIPALMMRLPVTKTLLLAPLALPPLGLAYYLALIKIKAFDHDVGADIYHWRKFVYQRRRHGYYNFRKGE